MLWEKSWSSYNNKYAIGQVTANDVGGLGNNHSNKPANVFDFLNDMQGNERYKRTMTSMQNAIDQNTKRRVTVRRMLLAHSANRVPPASESESL